MQFYICHQVQELYRNRHITAGGAAMLCLSLIAALWLTSLPTQAAEAKETPENKNPWKQLNEAFNVLKESAERLSKAQLSHLGNEVESLRLDNHLEKNKDFPYISRYGKADFFDFCEYVKNTLERYKYSRLTNENKSSLYKVIKHVKQIQTEIVFALGFKKIPAYWKVNALLEDTGSGLLANSQPLWQHKDLVTIKIQNRTKISEKQLSIEEGDNNSFRFIHKDGSLAASVILTREGLKFEWSADILKKQKTSMWDTEPVHTKVIADELLQSTIVITIGLWERVIFLK